MEERKLWIVITRNKNKKQTEKTFDDVREAFDYILDELIGNMNLTYLEMFLATRFLET